ncbi:MAG TPA: MFS transporter, partial [Tessaracoccus flavescens]|nr:MFS transporter [Tessaracoccus flavescens]
ELKDHFDLSATAFGLTVAAFPIGSVAAASLPAVLIRRFGAPTVAAASTVVLAVMIFLAGNAPAHWVLAAALFLAGFSDAVTDSAQNVQGVRVQRAMRKTIINSLHALWSLGATLGGLLGATMAGMGVPLSMHLGATGLACVVLVALAARWSHVEAREEGTETDGVAPVSGRRIALGFLLPLVAISISGMMIEDVANNWSTLYLKDVFGLPIGLAGLGFSVFIGGQFLGRLAGDPMTDRWGRVPVARAGGALIAAGILVAMISPWAALAMAGFAAAGFGCATLIPAAFAAAAEIPSLKEGTGITLLSWLMRLSLVSSPLIGAIVDASTLRAGMIPALAAGVAAIALARSLQPQAR